LGSLITLSLPSLFFPLLSFFHPNLVNFLLSLSKLLYRFFSTGDWPLHPWVSKNVCGVQSLARLTLKHGGEKVDEILCEEVRRLVLTMVLPESFQVLPSN